MAKRASIVNHILNTPEVDDCQNYLSCRVLVSASRPFTNIINLLKEINLFLLCCGLLNTAMAQRIVDFRLDGTEQGKPLSAYLPELEKNQSCRFYFLPEWVDQYTFNERHKNQTLGEALDDLLEGSDLYYFSMYPNVVVIVKDPTQAILRRNAIQTAIKQNKKIVQYSFGEPGKSNKSQVIISGKVVDAKTEEPLLRANIQVGNTATGTTTDESGYFTLKLNPGLHVLNISFIDFETKVVDLIAWDDGRLNIEMEKAAILLEEVMVIAQAERELKTSRIGEVQLTMKELKRAPSFLGEADLIKQVQALPGVTTVGEAASGFNVRGGSVDQNLILFDGLPMFNSSHVFGFFSAFNSEAIQNVSFYRGGIPAEYGGRVSSVLDIRSRDGSFEKWGGNAGIGLFTSNAMIHGPLKKDKTSMAASFRSTYSDWLVHSIRTNYADLRNSTVRFYDGTARLTHVYNKNTRLSVSSYFSKDGFRLMGDTTYQWKSFQLSAKVDHQLSARLSSEFIAGISTYGYNVLNDEQRTASDLSYQIATTMLKAGFHYQQGKHRINFGWQLLHYRFNPGTVKPASSISNARDAALDKQYAIENAFFVNDEWSVKDNLYLEAGLRLPLFMSFGPASINTYLEGMPLEITNVSDTLHYGRGEIIKSYLGLEPRLSMRWNLGPAASLKLGYNHMYQFLHLVTNSTAVTPVDIWQPSGYYFKPQQGDQVSIGYFRDFREKKYSASVETFYKHVKNVLDFKDGAQLIMNQHLETDLLQGKAYSYGLETYLSKNTGRLTGSINYTWSRAFRLIKGATAIESINSGNKYPASYDQPHVVNVAWKYNLSRRYFFTGNFTYRTGRPVTIPLSVFTFENNIVAYFSARNQFRIPDYHRLDMALVIEGNHRKTQRVKGTWIFSVYNVYGRMNPYSVFFRSTGNGVPKSYQLSIIGTVMPSISYNIKF